VSIGKDSSWTMIFEGNIFIDDTTKVRNPHLPQVVTFAAAHREAEKSNPQAASNIQTERSASNISIPATFLVSSLPCFSVSPQRARPRQATPINTESVAISVIPLQGIVPLRGRGPRMPRGVGRRRREREERSKRLA
jgi:hypothetical protein